MRRRVSLAALALLVALPWWAVNARPALAAEQCFAETGHCIMGRFLEYWNAHGGLAINGYPLTEERAEQLENGNRYQVQWFERVRLEYHPENAAPNDFLLGQFGRAMRAGDPPTGPQQGRRFFPETGHTMGGNFMAYRDRNGGLAQFGFPISAEFTETLDWEAVHGAVHRAGALRVPPRKRRAEQRAARPVRAADPRWQADPGGLRAAPSAVHRRAKL